VVTDHLGTPKELLDERGRVAWRAQHGAWGNVVEESRDLGSVAVKSPFRLLGQYHDAETGLEHTRFRCFEAATGRWLGPEPLGIRGGKNLCGFGGAPTIVSDPLGLSTGGCGGMGSLPPGAKIIWANPPKVIIYEMPDGSRRARFRADTALSFDEATRGRNYTTDSRLSVTPNGDPYVEEGRHRAIGVANYGSNVDPSNGGVPDAPGHLDYPYSGPTDPSMLPGKPVKGMTIDHGMPDMPKDQADQEWKKKFNP
jgi:RHS repeat-associated protein